MLSFARRRYLFTSIAVAGLAVTWAVMLAFDWAAKLGTIALAPWVALLAACFVFARVVGRAGDDDEHGGDRGDVVALPKRDELKDAA